MELAAHGWLAPYPKGPGLEPVEGGDMPCCSDPTSRYDAARDATDCVSCGATKRKPGRPKTDDPRTMRVKMSGAEWARCVEQARKAGAKTTAAWVRERCGL